MTSRECVERNIYMMYGFETALFALFCDSIERYLTIQDTEKQLNKEKVCFSSCKLEMP